MSGREIDIDAESVLAELRKMRDEMKMENQYLDGYLVATRRVQKWPTVARVLAVAERRAREGGANGRATTR